MFTKVSAKMVRSRKEFRNIEIMLSPLTYKVFRVQIPFTVLQSASLAIFSSACLRSRMYYLIGQNFVEQTFRHRAEILTILFDLCLTFALKYWTKYSTDKMFRRTKFSTTS